MTVFCTNLPTGNRNYAELGTQLFLSRPCKSIKTSQVVFNPWMDGFYTEQFKLILSTSKVLRSVELHIPMGNL